MALDVNGNLKFSEFKTIDGVRYWTFEMLATDVDMTSVIEVFTQASGIPDKCSVSSFKMSADGVALLNPILSRTVDAADDSLDQLITNEGAATVIRNQTYGVLDMQGKNLFIKPNANADNLIVKIEITICEGHGLRGI